MFARLVGLRWGASLLLLGIGLSLALLAAGCGGRAGVHPGLALNDPRAIEEATKRGVNLIKSSGDPYTLFNRTTREVNERLGSDVIVRNVSLCPPKEELAFRVAMAGDPSEEGAKRMADEALRQINRQVRFTVVLQILKSRKPEDVSFELITNQAKPYPPVAVEPPEFISDVSSAFDPSIDPMSVYGYNVYFATVGSPGFPAIDSSVTSLNLVIEADGVSTKVPFSITSLTTAVR